jgi:hypothetical protein
MQRFSNFDVQELKLVYRVLHKNLLGHIELMDADFLETLQTWLQYRAGQDGVDISVHSQWDAWLDGKAIPKSHTVLREVQSPKNVGMDRSGND